MSGESPVRLRGRGINGGVAEGEALVTREMISGWGGIDPMTGTVIEVRHELCGQSFRGRVLVFPGAKGSSGWSGMFHLARLAGAGPLAMVFTAVNTKMALGAVVSRVPCVTDLDRDPVEMINSGDRVRVDADRGLVEVLPPLPISCEPSPEPRTPPLGRGRRRSSPVV